MPYARKVLEALPDGQLLYSSRAENIYRGIGDVIGRLDAGPTYIHYFWSYSPDASPDFWTGLLPAELRVAVNDGLRRFTPKEFQEYLLLNTRQGVFQALDATTKGSIEEVLALVVKDL